LLTRPLAAGKRPRVGASSAPEAKRPVRAGKAWLEDLGDIEEEEEDS